MPVILHPANKIPSMRSEPELAVLQQKWSLPKSTTTLHRSGPQFCFGFLLRACSGGATAPHAEVLAYGFVRDANAYLRNGWNVLDFVVVVTGILSNLELEGMSRERASTAQ